MSIIWSYNFVFLCIIFTEPSGYPSELQIIMQTSLTVTFQWKALECYEENGPIIGYHYRAYQDLFHYDEGTANWNATTISLISSNLKSFSLAAMNEAGIGEHCPPIEVPNFDEG